jgi:hypothetical protein
MAVALDLQTEFLVINLKIAVRTARDRRRHNLLHFLRHHPDIGFVAAIVAEAIKAETVIEIAEEGDVVLEPDVRATSATTTAAAASTATAAMAAAGAHSAAMTSAGPNVATATAASVHSATSAAAGAHLGSTSAASPCVATVTAAAIGVSDVSAAA